ncbi:hypothetical protein [Dactylosporangium sp. NPDC051484]|uniref:hypothetical protein n=1 Tax=Dactylosporangium sp. NPDC051484 TaxID=3154942 RepID=UPI00344E8274
MGSDLRAAGLAVQAGQSLRVALLQAAAARLGELRPDRGAAGVAAAVLVQHRVQPVAPLRLIDRCQHFNHA